MPLALRCRTGAAEPSRTQPKGSAELAAARARLLSVTVLGACAQLCHQTQTGARGEAPRGRTAPASPRGRIHQVSAGHHRPLPNWCPHGIQRFCFDELLQQSKGTVTSTPCLPPTRAKLRSRRWPRTGRGCAHHHLGHELGFAGEDEVPALATVVDGLADHADAPDEAQLQGQVLSTEGRVRSQGQRFPAQPQLTSPPSTGASPRKPVPRLGTTAWSVLLPARGLGPRCSSSPSQALSDQGSRRAPPGHRLTGHQEPALRQRGEGDGAPGSIPPWGGSTLSTKPQRGNSGR